MDPLLISACIGIASLIIERGFKYLGKARRSHFKSSCCNGGVVIERDLSLPNINENK